jgi:hypothetical protein
MGFPIFREPKLFYQERIRVPQKLLIFFLRAVHGGLQGAAEVQAEHFHEAFAVDLMAVITHQNPVGTAGCQGYKLLNIL